MKLYYDLTDAIQRYLVTGDEAHLYSAIQVLESEIRDPLLQSSILTLDSISAKQAEMIIAKEGYLRISTQEVTNTEGIPVELDKYIRVIDKAFDGATSLVLKVAAITNDYLLLIPYSPATGMEGETDGTND